MRPTASGRWCLGAVALFGGLLVRETRGPGEAARSRWTPLHQAARAAATLFGPASRAEQTAILAARGNVRPLS